MTHRAAWIGLWLMVWQAPEQPLAAEQPLAGSACWGGTAEQSSIRRRPESTASTARKWRASSR